jgi:hypothetical protein
MPEHTPAVWVNSTRLPLEDLMRAEFTTGLKFFGIINVGATVTRLDETWSALPMWQKFLRETRYRWRYECLWVMSRACQYVEGGSGIGGILEPRMDWAQFLDDYAQELVRQWSMMPWWNRVRYAIKTLTWLAYVQEVRDDYARRMAESTLPPRTEGTRE